jgi:hypothetical protein
MKYIRPYKIFESNEPNFPTTREEVIEVCNRYRINNYTINDDLSIDVEGHVNLAYKNLEYLPLRFNYVSGDFSCYDNKLKTLEGCPQTVSGSFDCNRNKLKTLEGCPQTVSGSFDCYRNKLITLEGSPSVVNGNLICYVNELETLEGSPKTINGNFLCFVNKLKDLEYFPEVSDYINIRDNPVNLLVYTFIENEETDSFMIEDFIDYEIVRNGNTVMLDRLQTFIRDNDLKMPNLKEIKKHYKIIE